MGFISALIKGSREERMQGREYQFRSHENNEDRKLEKHKIDSYYDFAKCELDSKDKQFNTMHKTFNNIFEKLCPMLSNLAKPVPDFFTSIGKNISSPFDTCNTFCKGGMMQPFSRQMFCEMKY